MFQNYLMTAIRNLYKSKMYSLINIGGLAIGLAACILILLFVRDELSYDKWIPNAERIHKLEITFLPPGRGPMEFSATPGPAGPALQKDFPNELEEVTRVFNTGTTLKRDNESFDQMITYVDANFFRMFDLPMIKGSREQALSNNSSVILSEELAQKLYGDQDPIGQSFRLDTEYDYTVVGIFKDIPENTHFEFEMIALFDDNRYKDRPWVAIDWTSANMHTYLMTKPGVPIERVSDKFPEFIQNNVVLTFPGSDKINKSQIIQYSTIPVLDIHLKGDKPGHMKANGDIIAVYTFSAVAVLILVIASINFMNLSTARSLKRAREVSMRKVLGANRSQLIGQFLGEAVVTTVIALTLAVIMVMMVLPLFNDFTQKEMTLNIFGDPMQSLAIIIMTITVGVLGGIYPAFVLSGFRPAKILRANKSSAEGSEFIRNLLVVAQFTISITLMISTAIVYGQTLYAQNMNIGIDKGHKVVLRGLSAKEVNNQALTIAAEIKQLPGVRKTAFSTDSLPQTNMNNTGYYPSWAPDGQMILAEDMRFDSDFMELYNMPLLAGRTFDKDRASDYYIEAKEEGVNDTTTIIVNETFLAKAGITNPAEGVGTVFNMPMDDNKITKATVIGVVPDMNLRSLKFPITAMAFRPVKDDERVLNIEIDGAHMDETIDAIDAIWAKRVPDMPIVRRFVEEGYDRLYQQEEQRGQMFAGFALFAVFIACLGLYGLASFAADKRTKEVGIRKVMGASVFDIVKLLIWQFSKPVLVAMVLAWPIAWFMMQDWLNGFAYRLDLGAMLALFPLAGGLALLIAWGTVYLRANKAANNNPIKALRYE